MIELACPIIDKSCKMARIYFPSTLILDVFKDITGDQGLTNFPDARTFEENILKVRKAGTKIPLKAVTEMSAYFYREQEGFLVFLKSLTSQSIHHEVVNRLALDDFISKVNTLLLKDSQIRIENYEIIQKWVPNKAEKNIFLNINVPEYIQDYFAEALDYLTYGLYRSSILFCAIALEASLRYKYLELNGTTKIEKEYECNACHTKRKTKKEVTFNELITWAIEQKLIEVVYAERESLDFIRNYRNDLVHCNMNKPDAKLKISRNYAQQMSDIIVRLVEFFINNIFY